MIEDPSSVFNDPKLCKLLIAAIMYKANMKTIKIVQKDIDAVAHSILWEDSSTAAIIFERRERSMQ